MTIALPILLIHCSFSCLLGQIKYITPSFLVTISNEFASPVVSSAPLTDTQSPLAASITPLLFVIIVTCSSKNQNSFPCFITKNRFLHVFTTSPCFSSHPVFSYGGSQYSTPSVMTRGFTICDIFAPSFENIFFRFLLFFYSLSSYNSMCLSFPLACQSAISSSVNFSIFTIVLPFTLFFVNFTFPSTKLNKVWSVPIPQFSPGCHFVPRCLAMMFPGRTSSPPYFLMPKNFGFESRPFDVDPPAFFDANLTCVCCCCGCGSCGPPKTTLNDNKEDKEALLLVLKLLLVFFKQKRSIVFFHPQSLLNHESRQGQVKKKSCLVQKKRLKKKTLRAFFSSVSFSSKILFLSFLFFFSLSR